MKHSLHLSLVLASACLAGVAGCAKEASKSSTAGSSGTSAESGGTKDTGAEARRDAAIAKPAKSALARRDARASAPVAALHAAAPRAGAVSARPGATAGDGANRAALATKTPARMTQIASAMAKPGGEGFTSAVKTAVTRGSTSDAGARSGAAPRPPRNAAAADPGPSSVHALTGEAAAEPTGG
jgi:hypothetical protein